MKLFVVPIALASLAALAGADATRPDPWVLPYPSNFVSGSATKIAVGRFTDDLVADGALLCGGNVFLLYAPEHVCSYSRLVGPFTSMTKVDSSAHPGQQMLLASTSAGLSLIEWDPSARVLKSSAALADPTWAGATSLQTVHGGVDGGTVVCGLSTDGKTVLRVAWDGAHIVTGSSGSVRLPTHPLSFAGLHWNSDSLLDVAYDDGQGLRVLSGTGASLYSSTSACAIPKVLRFPQASGTDNVVWVTTDPATNAESLTVVHSSNGVAEAPIPASGVIVSEIALADVDADGRADLVATFLNVPLAMVFYGQASGSMSFGLFSGTGAGPTSINLVSAYAPSWAAPALGTGDLDGDGDEDVLCAGQPGDLAGVQAWFSAGVYDEVFQPGYESQIVKAWMSGFTYLDWSGGTAAKITLTPWNVPATGPSSAATDIRVSVWARSTSNGPIEPVSLFDGFFETEGDLHISLPTPAGNLPQYLVMTVGYVERNPQGAVVRSLPTWTGQIDRLNLPHPTTGGATTTGGVDRPPPPPTTVPSVPNP
ncbi:MAG: hypothetical protein IPJ19_08400 [Planctomycetes bacterium]|nr:hypothetical protein [Planctomycetota bacterium]